MTREGLWPPHFPPLPMYPGFTIWTTHSGRTHHAASGSQVILHPAPCLDHSSAPCSPDNCSLPYYGYHLLCETSEAPFLSSGWSFPLGLVHTSRELHHLSANLPPSTDKELLEGKNTLFFLNLLGPAQCLAQSRGSIIACWMKAQRCYLQERIRHNFIPITLTSLTAQEMTIHAGFKANDLIFFTQ